jgi:1,4-alpha-glucan branching enzyme
MTTMTRESPGYASFVLHTHLPYCRLAGRWPHGEEWIHEALLECYLPLLSSLRRLASEGAGSLGVTINMTPILTEQLADPLIIEHFREYALDRLVRAERDIVRFKRASEQHGIAAFYRDRFKAAGDLFEELSGDFAGALRALEDSGHIEIATSAATHAYLPLLKEPEAVEFQVRIGIESHVRHFGRRPRSFWLPECAYYPGIENVLERHGVRVFFVENHLVDQGVVKAGSAFDAVNGQQPTFPSTSPGDSVCHGSTFQAYRVADSNVAAIARNSRTGKQVWSADEGYPGHAAYREFHRKDAESGLRYWRVTGPEAGQGEKEFYEPSVASSVIARQAEHFTGIIRDELRTAAGRGFARPIVLSAYDTELFGHWWMEGAQWMEAVLRDLRNDSVANLITAADYVELAAPADRITMPAGSWGNGGDDRTWRNEQTAWTWPEIWARQSRATKLHLDDSDRARQVARELLLLQASDWQFLMTTGQAAEYATQRFRSHCDRFDRLAEAIETGTSTNELTDEYARLDNPFPWLEPTAYAGPTASEPRL